MTLTPIKGKQGMADRVRFPFDRRSETDRRVAYKLGYFTEGGAERRRYQDRRAQEERRSDWIRVSEWSSVWRELFDPGGYCG